MTLILPFAFCFSEVSKQGVKTSKFHYPPFSGGVWHQVRLAGLETFFGKKPL